MGEQRASQPAGNLPVLASSFVGRHQELAEVRRQLEAARLLTLTGPGGVGKTRLAVQAGSLARRAFPHGVWLADLAAVEDPARLADAVAVAVGVKDQSPRLAREQLADFLTDRRLLLILDNCEHLVEACATLVDHLLRGAPGLRVLATSRQPLRIPGERLLTVPPLPVPAGVPSVAALSTYESVALLVDRASAVLPGFAVHEGNREAVARLCARLDGLPLAIELAATRLRALSVAQVADRLDDRFQLLNRGSPAATPRQQTLRALMDWSYELCSQPQRRLWACLAVFPAEFDLEAVEAVCIGTGMEPGAVVDLLDDLVAKSVVSARPQLPQARYRLLETIRQYGRELLAGTGREAELRRRHRDHYLRLAVRSCAAWCGPGQAENLARLQTEWDNLAAALDWSLSEPGQTHSALVMVSALRYHWAIGEFLAAGRRRLDQVLQVAGEPTRERGDALWVAAWVSLLQGDGDTAAERLRECADIAERHDDDHLRGYISAWSGTRALFAGDPATAARLFADGIALLRKQEDPAGVLVAQFQQTVALSFDGDSAAAQAVYAEAIGLAERHGETWARSEAMWAYAIGLWVSGDPHGTAADLVRGALAIAPNENPVGMVLCIELLAWIAASRSRHAEAARLLGAAAAIWESIGTTIAAFGPTFASNSEHCHQSTLSALGGARFQTLRDEGHANPMAQVRVPRAEPPGAPASTPVLTPRERQVAALIAKGLTNKAIAADLVLSPRTVDGHVQRLFDKLGVSTRAQVAVWLAQRSESGSATG